MYRLLLFFLIFCFSCKENPKPESSNLEAFLKTDVIPLQNLHSHGATIVELPNGDLLSAWFLGSGERWADDVAIMGARLLKGETKWSEAFVMADVPAFPDINPSLFLDSQGRLWLAWYTVLANLWETSLPKYRISEDFMMKEGAPVWKWQEVLHVKPGGSTERGIQPADPFVHAVESQMKAYEAYLMDSLGGNEEWLQAYRAWASDKLGKARGDDQQFNGYLYGENGEISKQKMGFPLFRRIGWQTKNKAILIDDKRLILPLYSDGLGFSIMAITDDDGESWQFSSPLVGLENIQASIVSKRNGHLVAYMRDNGPPPQRMQMSTSKDKGLSWGKVRDSDILNPGSGADMIVLENGHWVLAYNDTEEGRHSLAVSLSEDEGKSWPYIRHIEYDPGPGENRIRAGYPSAIQSKDGLIHVIYSYTTRREAEQKQECIKYIRFEENWIRAGDD
ncbi:MAG: exo-alpha-sialidase [Bacteroidia bacterium]|nr:exo-alpha-sialidase [Bacteroidia bacterium]